MIGQLKYLTVENKVGGTWFIQHSAPYLIISAKKADETIELHPSNIINNVTENKFIDLLSAESDYFTRLIALGSIHIDISALRTGETTVNQFTHVLVMEYTDPVNTY